MLNAHKINNNSINKYILLVKASTILITVFFLTFTTKSKAAQDATVVTDGAMVYKTANFDSAVLGYLRAGETVRISNKTIGAFYRVKFEKRIGYISDVDVRPIKADNPTSEDQINNNEALNNRTNEGEPKTSTQKVNRTSVDSHLAKLSYAGITASYFLNHNYIVNNTGRFFTYGLKFNFSSQLFSGSQVWDITTHFTLTPPEGYQSNLTIFLDLQLLFLLDAIMGKNGFLFVGLGPTINRWSLKREDSGNVEGATQSKFNFGAVVSFHFGLHIQSVLLKIEPRYYISRKSSPAISISLQKML